MEELLHEPHYIDGTIEAVYFENVANFYKVMRVKVLDNNLDYDEDEIVVTGSFGQTSIGEDYHFVGTLVDHAKFGLQFQVQMYSQLKPNSENGVIAYLSSEKFSGIGKKIAQNIVKELGTNAIERILEDPSLLENVTGMTQKRQDVLLETLRLNYGMEKIIIGLNDLGFGSQLSFAIYQKYKNQTLEIIQNNPYQLVEDIDGIGFGKADLLAEQVGISADSPARIQAAILHTVLQQSLDNGDTYIEADDLLTLTQALLESARPVEIRMDAIANEILALVEDERIQQDGLKLAENSLHFAEIGIASSIERLLSRKKEIDYKKTDIEKGIKKIQKLHAISYGNSQKTAIEQAMQSPFFILTGGPGTGKTTVINGIVQLFAELNDISLDLSDYHNALFPIMLAAPTGRASKRMNETTGLPAGTIHRLLGLTGRESEPVDETRELEGGLLIVDEFSMVDTWLANLLLKAIPTNMQVIFVGDKDQLPSVGPGQVLHDLLQIKEIPKVELTDIYRQGDGSSIIPLAHEIKNGYLPNDFLQNQKDRSYFSAHPMQIEGYIRNIVQKAKAKGFTAQDIQVLAPMYKGPAGINALNKMLQNIFNPNDTGKRKEMPFNDIVYRIGDKVLNLVNEPELNVFNGDFGIITGIIPAKLSEDKTDELIIDFDGNEISYARKEWNKITLSYATSIHKAQGSEFKMVILPFVMSYRRMLQRNLLYTAITRSKELLILLGEVEAFQTAVTSTGSARKTSLQERIAAFEHLHKLDEELPELVVELKNHILSEKLIASAQIDARIGMEDLTPYDFN